MIRAGNSNSNLTFSAENFQPRFLVCSMLFDRTTPISLAYQIQECQVWTAASCTPRVGWFPCRRRIQNLDSLSSHKAICRQRYQCLYDGNKIRCLRWVVFLLLCLVCSLSRWSRWHCSSCCWCSPSSSSATFSWFLMLGQQFSCWQANIITNSYIHRRFPLQRDAEINDTTYVLHIKRNYFYRFFFPAWKHIRYISD